MFREDTLFVEPGRYPLIVGLSEGGRDFHYVEKAGSLQIAEVSDFGEETSHVVISNCGIVLNQLQVEINKTNPPPAPPEAGGV